MKGRPDRLKAKPTSFATIEAGDSGKLPKGWPGSAYSGIVKVIPPADEHGNPAGTCYFCGRRCGAGASVHSECEVMRAVTAGWLRDHGFPDAAAEVDAGDRPYCPACDYDKHQWPGCGRDVPHGDVACVMCLETEAGR